MELQQIVQLQQVAWIATAISSLGILGSVIMAARNLSLNRKNQLRATASRLWDNYLSRSIQYPEFAFPENFISHYDFDNMTFKGERKEFERYEWFVSSLLRSSAEILEGYDRSDRRCSLIATNIKCHRYYLSWRKNHAGHFDLNAWGPNVGKILQAVIADVQLDERRQPRIDT